MRSSRASGRELTAMKGRVTKLSRKLSKSDRALKHAQRSLARTRSEERVSSSILDLFKMANEQNVQTRRALDALMARLDKIEERMGAAGGQVAREEAAETQINGPREVDLSPIDVKIIQFIQTKDGMACADEVKEYMNYRGRNAACTRLNRLCRDGILERHRMGRKVYYKYDAGKTTEIRILAPLQ